MNEAVRSEVGRYAQQLLVLSREMLERADAGDWSGLAEREARRQKALKQLYASPLSQAEEAFIAPMMRQMLALNEEIVRRTESGVRQIENSISALDQGRRLTRGHRDTGGEG